MSEFKKLITLTQIFDGAQGEPGPAADRYLVQSNQEEILKFYEQENLIFSPSELDFWLEKEGAIVPSEVLEFYIIFNSKAVNYDLSKLLNFITSKDNKHTLEIEDILLIYQRLNETEELFKEETVSSQEQFDNGLYYIKIEENGKVYYTRATEYIDSTEIIYYVVADQNAYDYYDDIAELFEKEEPVIRIKLQSTLEEEYATKIINSRFGTSQDAAKFSVHASGISASIQGAGLEFDSNGLTIHESGFQIVKKNEADEEEVVFSANEQGNLILRGDVYAENGEFNGTIIAKAGSIEGMLSIGSNNNIIHLGKEEVGEKTYEGIYSSSYKDNEEKGFIILPNGEIKANQLYIGTGAQINDYLQMGNSNSYLQNPSLEKYSNVFLAIRDKEIDVEDSKYIVSLDTSGMLNLGSLKLNGANSSIQSNSYSSGASGWYIGEDKAEFNDITVRGKLESAVMSYGDVQTVGGILIVRPSTIFRVENDEYYLDNSAGFNAGDYCTIGESADQTAGYYTIDRIENIEGLTKAKIFFKETDNLSGLNGKIITSYGQIKYKVIYEKVEQSNSEKIDEYYIKNGENYEKAILYDENQTYYLQKKTDEIDKKSSTNIGIGLNASSNAAACAPNAISVFEIGIEEGKTVRNNRIILGKMNGEDKYGNLEGYGLYADNVYLNGSLISSTPSGSTQPYYSGINTSSGEKMPNDGYFVNKNIGEILFWAGAESKKDIVNAPFKVDSYGNLYASSGYFEGSVITKATITAARMRTAVLEGWDVNNNEKAALEIKNTSNAISFKNDDEVYMSLNSNSEDGFYLNLSAVFDKEINVNGTIYANNGIEVKNGKSVKFDKIVLQEKEESGLNIDHNNQFVSSFSNQKINLNKPTYHTSSILSTSGEVEIKWVSDGNDIIGYDLYIKE